MKLTNLAINNNAKKSYNKPQALELSVQTTAGGSTEPVEAMMGTAPNRKVNTGS